MIKCAKLIRISLSTVSLFSIFTLLACHSALAVDATTSHFTFSPQALYSAASAAKVEEGHGVSYLQVHETYEFETAGDVTYTQHIIYKVINQTGVENSSELSVEWSPWRGQPPTLRARVVTSSGESHILDPSTIENAPAGDSDNNVYSDARIARAPLPAIAPGSVVETEIVMKERAFFPGAGTIGRSYFQYRSPVEQFKLTLKAPRAVTLKFRLDLLPNLKHIRSEDGDTQSLVFEHGPVGSIEDIETGLPSDVFSYPMVSFSTGASWNALAKAYSTIVDTQIAKANVAELTQRLIKNRLTREDKISSLVEYLNKEIRYTGIEYDQSSVIPHTPSETLSRKYGDCKDKSVLLVAMLRTAGIPAYVALLNAGSRLDVPPELAGMGLFDHAIVYVPGEPEYWIDATDASARLGQLPDDDHGRSALVIREESTALSKVVEARSTDNVILEEREIVLADIGPGRITEISKPQGNYEPGYRRAYADIGGKKLKEDLAAYMQDEYLSDKLDRFERSDPKDFSKGFTLTLGSKKIRRGETSLNDATAYIIIDSIFNGLPRDLRTREQTEDENAKSARPKKKRVNDWQLNRPSVKEWRYHVVPPAGFEVAQLPANLQLDLGPTRLTQEYVADTDGSVRAVLRFDTVKARFSPAEQTEIRKKVADLIDGPATMIKFNLKADSLLTQGHARESFQAYRDLVKAQPKDAVSHLRRADALLRAGMGESARAEARTAIKLDPKSAIAQETLARILQHDLVGRWRREGADFNGAVAALRAAIALDPSNKTRVADLAIVLEFDDFGARYSTLADLHAAIAEYEKLTPQERANLEIAQNLPVTMLYAGDFSRAKQIAESLASPSLNVIAASDAMLFGADRAMQEARRRTSNDEAFKEVMLSAGNTLMHLREYDRASVLLEAGASGNNVAQTLSLASILRNAKRFEDIHFENTPGDFVKQVVAVPFLSGGDVEAMRKLASLNLLASEKFETQVERDNRAAMDRFMRLTATRAGVPQPVLLDIALQSIDVKTSGNEVIGYRATVQMPGQRNQTLFIVKENGRYKILDDGNSMIALALEVLDRVKRHDLAGASGLLDLLRDITPMNGGDDIYAGAVFPYFWDQKRGDLDERRITLAAASLLVPKENPAKLGITILEDAKKQPANENELRNINFALMTGYLASKNYEHALPLCMELAKRAPLSKQLFYGHSMSLMQLNRFDAADELARKRLEALPEDTDALRILAANSIAQRDYKAAYERARNVSASSNSNASDFNDAAWFSLFFDRVEGPDVDSAIRASRQNENNAAYLHTLASVYAEIGKTKEAHDLLLRVIDLRNLDQPNSDVWYTLGRIAEQYGEIEVAIANYSKVTPAKQVAQEPIATMQLAKNRLKVLGARKN